MKAVVLEDLRQVNSLGKGRADTLRVRDRSLKEHRMAEHVVRVDGVL